MSGKLLLYKWGSFSEPGMEKVFKQNNIDYFDGFGGRVEPKFSTANFGKIITLRFRRKDFTFGNTGGILLTQLFVR